MYIVSGATGQTGSVVARTLLEKNLPVRAIVRSEEKGKSLKDSGAQIAVADLRDAGALTEALDGGTVLYLMIPPNEQSADMFAEAEKIIAAYQTAIENSRLEKLVVLSSVGAQLPNGTGAIMTNRSVEKAFEGSSIPVTFLRATYFMENWNSVLDAAAGEGVLPSFLQPLDRKIPQVAAEDIGREAAEAMLEKTDGVQIKELAGFDVSPNDVAEAFSKVLGREIKAVAVPENQWLDIMKTFASPRNADAYYEMTKWVNSARIPFETKNPIEGKFTLENYASRMLK